MNCTMCIYMYVQQYNYTIIIPIRPDTDAVGQTDLLILTSRLKL